MKQSQITRLVTRRSFSKTTIQGVGALVGLSVWSKSHATAYNNTQATVAACHGAISSICNAKHPNNPSRVLNCKLNLTGAYVCGREGTPNYPWRTVSGVSTLENTNSDCNAQMDHVGFMAGLSNAAIDTLQNNCCHSVT
jgi:hypothetical protein